MRIFTFAFLLSRFDRFYLPDGILVLSVVLNDGGEYGSKVNGGGDCIRTGWGSKTSTCAGVEQPNKAIADPTIPATQAINLTFRESFDLGLMLGVFRLLDTDCADKSFNGFLILGLLLFKGFFVGLLSLKTIFGDLGFVTVFCVAVTKVNSSSKR